LQTESSVAVDATVYAAFRRAGEGGAASASGAAPAGGVQLGADSMRALRGSTVKHVTGPAAAPARQTVIASALASTWEKGSCDRADGTHAEVAAVAALVGAGATVDSLGAGEVDAAGTATGVDAAPHPAGIATNSGVAKKREMNRARMPCEYEAVGRGTMSMALAARMIAKVVQHRRMTPILRMPRGGAIRALARIPDIR
jgi:hypothetical protein